MLKVIAKQEPNVVIQDYKKADIQDWSQPVF